MKVAVLGASDDPNRYAHLAVQRLRERHHDVIGINPRLPDLGDVPVVSSVGELPPGVDTLTVYVSPKRLDPITEELVRLPVRRVIFNPGSEHPELATRIAARGVEVVEACTLVLLATGHFDRS